MAIDRLIHTVEPPQGGEFFGGEPLQIGLTGGAGIELGRTDHSSPPAKHSAEELHRGLLRFAQPRGVEAVERPDGGVAEPIIFIQIVECAFKAHRGIPLARASSRLAWSSAAEKLHDAR